MQIFSSDPKTFSKTFVEKYRISMKNEFLSSG